MLRKRRVKDSADTELMPGKLVDASTLARVNEGVVAEGLQPATADFVLLGITEAALATESFLSAASFQKTTKVLTEAATHGRVDVLAGLKENVIIGRLIPAGTGLKRRGSVEVFEDEAAREYAEANRDAFNADELRARPKKEAVPIDDTDALFALDTPMLGDIDPNAMAEAGFSVDDGAGAAGILDDDSEPSVDDLLGDEDLASDDDLGALLGGTDDE